MFGPETNVSRPITDRVKESLFSVLCNTAIFGRVCTGRMPVLRVADLFCGVGSLGLEALSRGAGFVTFVEKNRNIIATLKKNIEKAGFAGESKVIRADAFKIGAPVDEQKHDLVFVDPPYSATRETKAGHGTSRTRAREGSPLSKLLVLLSEQSAVGGIVVVRTEKRTELLERYGRFEVIERRQWGTMAVTILQRSSK